jgi:gamma-carbonic anhydrase
MVHCSSHPKDLPTKVESGVTVGAGAILHGCVLEEGSVVGAGAQVMDGASVGKQAIVAPGSLVGVGKKVPAGQLWSGVPARFVRDLTQAEKDQMAAAAAVIVENSLQHALENAKTWQTIEQEEYDLEQKNGRADYYYRRLSDEVSGHFEVFSSFECFEYKQTVN